MMSVPFVVLSITRSGSTWFISLLNGQPGVVAFEELFLDQIVPEKYKWLTTGSPPRFHTIKHELGDSRTVQMRRYLELVRDHGGDSRAYGFKLMLNYPTLGILGALARRRYRLVCLVRDNLFEGAVSRLALQMTDDAHSAEPEDAGARLRLDPQMLVHQMRRRRFAIHGLHTAARVWPWPAQVVRYDDLVRDQLATLQPLLNMLGIEAAAVEAPSTLIRRMRRPYRDILENADEVATAVQAAGLGHYLPTSINPA
jgi:LPS sulfotransferase NodH